MNLRVKGRLKSHLGLVSGPNGPEAGRVFDARRACTHRSFDPQDTCGLSPSEGVIIKQTRVHASGWWSRRIRCRIDLGRSAVRAGERGLTGPETSQVWLIQH